MSAPQKPRRLPHRWVAGSPAVSAAGRKGGRIAGNGRPLRRKPKPPARSR